MKYSLLTIALLAMATNSLIASDKPDASDKGTLSQDHTNEPSFYSDDAIQIGVLKWKMKGDIRAGWLQYGYHNPPTRNTTPFKSGDPTVNKGHTDSKGFYVIPKLSLIAETDSGFSLKITGAAATDFGMNDQNYESRNFVFDGGTRKSFAILQEALVQYQDNNQKIVIGRDELTTPMIDADDWYMLANSFELGYYENTTLDNTMFLGGYFQKMAGVWDSGANGTEFHSMSDASFVNSEDKSNADNSGVVFGAYQYNNGTHNAQVWNYYATDLYNTLFAQYDFTSKVGGMSYDLGAQFINFKEVGKLADNSDIPLIDGSGLRTIDASMYSIRFDGSFENGINFATGATKYSDGDGFGSVLGAWGGYPYFANGMIFHFFEAGTLQNAASYKAQLGYDILDGLWIGGRYTYWDLDPSESETTSGDPQNAMNMYGVRLSYSGVAGTYFTGTYEYVDLDNEPGINSLRLIGGIKF